VWRHKLARISEPRTGPDDVVAKLAVRLVNTSADLCHLIAGLFDLQVFLYHAHR
jgi:hypothetical protein